MEEGYIKFFRKIIKSPIFKNEKALKIWIWCLCKATYIERDQLVGQQLVHLKEGQFVFGRKTASDELNINENTVYKYMKLLESLKMCNIKSNNKFSIVTIEKWQEYQISNNNIEQQSNNKLFWENNNKLEAVAFDNKELQTNDIINYNNKYGNSNNNNKEKPVIAEGVKNFEMSDFKNNNNNNNKVTTKEHKQEYKEIYLYYLNIYKSENLKTFFDKMNFLRKIKEDERYKELDSNEEKELRSLILNEN